MFVLTFLLSSEIWGEFGEGAHQRMTRQVFSLGVERTAELTSGTGSVGLGTVKGKMGLLVAVRNRGGAGRAGYIMVGAFFLPVGLLRLKSVQFGRVTEDVLTSSSCTVMDWRQARHDTG